MQIHLYICAFRVQWLSLFFFTLESRSTPEQERKTKCHSNTAAWSRRNMVDQRDSYGNWQCSCVLLLIWSLLDMMLIPTGCKSNAVRNWVEPCSLGGSQPLANSSRNRFQSSATGSPRHTAMHGLLLSCYAKFHSHVRTLFDPIPSWHCQVMYLSWTKCAFCGGCDSTFPLLLICLTYQYWLGTSTDGVGFVMLCFRVTLFCDCLRPQVMAHPYGLGASFSTFCSQLPTS